MNQNIRLSFLNLIEPWKNQLELVDATAEILVDVAERASLVAPRNEVCHRALVQEHAVRPTSPPPLATSGVTYSCVPTDELDRASTGSATNRGLS
jgi:hypothetical protein